MTHPLRQINKEKHDFESKQIQVVPGLYFNQKDTIETIYFYYNSKFKSGEVDEEGDRKYFYNIVRNPCKVYTKAIDFDTKHIRLTTAAGGVPTKTWFMERDLKFWMKDKQFGKVLNRIFRELPIFGSVVLKVVNGEVHFVDLRNFIVEQGADTLDQSNYITEIHYYTPVEFLKVGREAGWSEEDMQEALKKFREMKDEPHITVYERYGEILDDERAVEPTYTYKKLIVADVGKESKSVGRSDLVPYKGVLLKEEEWEGHPYIEFHLEKIAGRWLGYGVVEALEEPQIRQNEICNLQAKGSYWAAARVFQTRDQGVNKNLRTEVANGEVLTVDSEITQVDMSDRNLAFFNDETLKWNRNRDELTFSYDVIQGERLPAGTPLGSARIAAAMINSHFDQIRENIGMDVKEMLYDVVVPRFQKENTSEHTLRIAGQDLDKLEKMLISSKLKEELFSFMERQGRLPDNKQYEITKIGIEEAVRQGKEKMIKIPSGFYKNIKYDIDIEITGEMKDTQVQAQTKFALLQAITTDPSILVNPIKKKILMSIAEDGGVNLLDFIEEEKSQVEQLMMQVPQGAGGGVSAPNIRPEAPLVGEGQRTL